MKTTLRAAAAALAFAFLPAAASAAEPILGKVETLYVAMSRDLLVEYTPGMHTHGRPLMAEVRLRDASGQAARRVFLRLEGENVEAGDVVAVNERSEMRNVPLQSRDRLAYVEAKHNTETARYFFRETPRFVALKRAE
jgi:hypothetical protein